MSTASARCAQPDDDGDHHRQVFVLAYCVRRPIRRKKKDDCVSILTMRRSTMMDEPAAEELRMGQAT
jgi:hypothetical protein